MILKAFWQQKFDIKRLYKGSNVSDRGYNVFVNVAIDLRIILSRQMFMRFLCCVQVVFFKWDPSKRKAWVALLSGAQGYYYCQTLFSFAFFIWKNNRI